MNLRAIKSIKITYTDDSTRTLANTVAIKNWLDYIIKENLAITLKKSTKD